MCEVLAWCAKFLCGVSKSVRGFCVVFKDFIVYEDFTWCVRVSSEIQSFHVEYNV